MLALSSKIPLMLISRKIFHTKMLMNEEASNFVYVKK